MKDLLPYPGLAPAVEAALVALETAERFDGLEAHYRTLLAERDRRIPAFLVPVLPTWALGFGLVWVAQKFGFLPESAPWAYAFLPILFVALVMWRVRPNAARDDTRIGQALAKWKQAAEERGLDR